MAAKREITTRFKLEGEGEYRKAMTDAANALKVLDSEQKLAKAQFEQTGDAQAYAAEQARILKDKISEQQKAVAAAEEAVKSMKNKGVDPTDRTYQNWVKRLNDANTSLTTMQTELSGVETGMKDADKATGEFDDKLDSIDKEVRFANTLKIVEDMRDRLNSIVRAAAQAGRAIWDIETDAGKWADDLSTAASAAKMDVETYQSWQYASRFIDSSVDDISKSIRKMESDLGSSSEETAKVFNELSVSTRNADGSVRDATDVFWDTVDALHNIEDATKQGILAQKLLGSHYNTLNPLIQAGSAAYKRYAEEGREIAVVSEEQVAALAQLNDTQEQLNAVLQKAKYDTLAALAPTFQTVADAMSKAVQGFNEFTQSVEGQAALSALNDALSGLVKSFLGEDNGQGTFQAIAEGAAGAVNTFTDALTWISEHGETVKGIMLGLGAAWVGLNVAPPVMKFMHLLNKTPLSKLQAVFGSGASAAAEAAGSAAAGGAAQAASGTGGSFISRAAGKVTPVLSAAAPYLALGAGTAVLGAVLDKQSVERNYGEYNRLRESGRIEQVLEEAQESGGNLYAEALAAFEEGIQQQAEGGTVEGIVEAAEKYRNLLPDIFPSVEDTNSYNAMAWYDLATQKVIPALTELAEESKGKGEETAQSYAQGMEDNTQAAVAAAEAMAQQTVEEAEEEMSYLETVGQDAANRMAAGIAQNEGAAVDAAQHMANQVIGVINNMLSQVAAATASLPVFSGFSPSFAMGQGYGSSRSSINVDLIMDKKIVGTAVAPVVNNALGMQMLDR